MADPVFTPGRIGTLHLPHRIVMGSMHLGVEGAPDCAQAAAFYAARARGGAALIVTGGWAVSRVGAGGGDYGLVNDPAWHEGLARIALKVHDAGALVALQLFHAGRYAPRSAFGLTPVAPSAVPSRFDPRPPAALDEDQIAATIDDFARAAATAVALGFDAVELMGSEGYLLNQFCSPLTNRRDDAWGGDAARRRAFPLAVLASVRSAAGPGFPVIYRMSGADLMKGSSAPAETVDLAQALATGGADALNIGIGWHESRVPTVQNVVPGGMWNPVAVAITRALAAEPAAARVAVIAGNRINRIDQARAILAAGDADFVSMARPFLADPDLIGATRQRRAINICIGCDQACIDRSLVGDRVSCLVNPAAGFEEDGPPPPARPGATFAVIGGGPAGLAAARELALAGAAVTLFEADAELGGQFRLARLVPGKGDYGGTIDYYAAQLQELGVTVRLGAPVTAGDPGVLGGVVGAAGAVLATGVHPREVCVPGLGEPGTAPVWAYPEAFTRRGELGGRIAIIGGGGIGVDLAHLLSHPEDVIPAARQVTVMRRAGKVGAGIGRTMRWVLIGELRRAGVRMLTGLRYRAITPDGVRIDTDDGPRLIGADTVVVAAGQVPNDGLAAVLRQQGVPLRVVGGARSTDRLDAVRAFAEGRQAARELLTCARDGTEGAVR